MTSIDLKNFRSFKETGELEIRPLTVFVGKNGSGKSSITRFLPLLRQSAEVRAAAPILWYGSYVDFGTLKEVKCKSYKDFPLGISIKFNISSFHSRRRVFFRRQSFDDVKISVELREVDGRTSISRFEMTLSKDNVILDVNYKHELTNIVVNSNDYSYLLKNKKITVSDNSLVPVLSSQDEKGASPSRIGLLHEGPIVVKDRIANIYKEVFDHDLTNDTVESILNYVDYEPKFDVVEQLDSFLARSYLDDEEEPQIHQDGYNKDTAMSYGDELQRLHLLHDLPYIFNIVRDAYEKGGRKPCPMPDHQDDL